MKMQLAYCQWNVPGLTLIFSTKMSLADKSVGKAKKWTGRFGPNDLGPCSVLCSWWRTVWWLYVTNVWHSISAAM